MCGNVVCFVTYLLWCLILTKQLTLFAFYYRTYEGENTYSIITRIIGPHTAICSSNMISFKDTLIIEFIYYIGLQKQNFK